MRKIKNVKKKTFIFNVLKNIEYEKSLTEIVTKIKHISV